MDNPCWHKSQDINTSIKITLSNNNINLRFNTTRRNLYLRSTMLHLVVVYQYCLLKAAHHRCSSRYTLLAPLSINSYKFLGSQVVKDVILVRARWTDVMRAVTAAVTIVATMTTITDTTVTMVTSVITAGVAIMDTMVDRAVASSVS